MTCCGSAYHGRSLSWKPEPGELFLEYAAALHVVGDDSPAGAIDEQEDRAVIGAEALAKITAGGKPGDRIG